MMDFLDFEGGALYYDEPVDKEVEKYIHLSSKSYGTEDAEKYLLRAYFLAPEHLTVLVALYRYFYYRHRYNDAILTGTRAIRIAGEKLGLPDDFYKMKLEHMSQAVTKSMTVTRFYMLAQKGVAYLELRTGNAESALKRLEKICEFDRSERLGAKSLLELARGATYEQVAPGKVHSISRRTF